MSTTDRIESLETRVRTLKKMLFGVVGLVAIGTLVAAMALPKVLAPTALPKVPDVIQAKKFEVVNDDGDVLVALGYFAAEVGERDVGYVMTANSDGNALVSIGSNVLGDGVITTNQGIGNCGKLVAITANLFGQGVITTMNGKGGELVVIKGTSAGGGAIVTTNDGEVTSRLP